MTLTKTDRARVIQSVGDGTVRRSANSSTTSPPRSGWGLGVKEPTAPKASRNTVPNPGTRLACWPHLGLQCYIIHTTLGNGYLGSRIDEERSEMRYLV